MKNVGLVLGTMTFGEQLFGDDVTEMIQYYLDHGFTELDTAYVYNDGKSEKFIGEALKKIERSKVKISTKVNPRITGRLDGNAAYLQLNESLTRLGIDNVDTFYLHFPDPDTPIDSVLEACADLHQQGKFKELGLSNFPAWLVTEVYYICKENGWVLPTVYEGLYNPLSRKAEIELNMALNHLNIRFYAYNPLAGGMLTNRYTDFSIPPSQGRFTYRPNYQNRYWKKSYFKAVETIKKICIDNKIDIVDAVYRWLAFHSMLDGNRGDSILIGASCISQLKQNILSLHNKELPDEVVQAINAAWTISKADAPEYFKFYTPN